jgi:hypothetical protein
MSSITSSTDEPLTTAAPASPIPPSSELTPDIYALIDEAMESTCGARCGFPVARRSLAVVRAHVVESVQQWLSVAPGDLDQVVVNGWARKWRSYCVDSESSSRVQEHHALLEERESLRRQLERREKAVQVERESAKQELLRLERERLFAVEMSRLTQLAYNPIEYGVPTDSSEHELDSRDPYAEFATLLRQHGIAEAAVFDLLVRVSEMTGQCQKVVPHVTPLMHGQLQARVLVDYYEHEHIKSSEAEQTKLAATNGERRDEILMAMVQLLEEISNQLAIMSGTAERQARTVSTMKTLQLVDGFFDSLNRR